MKVVLFDFDGVIIDIVKYYFEVWYEIVKLLDIEIDEIFNEKLKGISREELLDKILLFVNKVDSYIKEEKLKVCEEKNNIYIKLINLLIYKDILLGINEFIKEFKKNNVKLGIVFVSKNVFRILEFLGIKDEFDCIVNLFLLKRGKLYFDIFIEGSKILNLK